MYVYVPSHPFQRMPSSRRQAIPSTRSAAVVPGIELHGRPIPGLAASLVMLAAIALLVVGFLHGTVDLALVRALS